MLPIRIGFFLAIRQIRRSTKWSTILIIAIMMLTFLNLVVVSGLLVGLPEGSVGVLRLRYTSDVLVSTLRDEEYIERSNEIIQTIERLSDVSAYSARYVSGGTLEANYKTRVRVTDTPETVSALIAGINPAYEHAVTKLADLVVEGSYLDENDFDQILVGSLLLEKYLPIDTPGMTTLRDVGVGSTVRLQVGNITREVTIKGVVKSKVQEVDRRVFMTDKQLRTLIGRTDFNVNEIAISVHNEQQVTHVKDALIANGFDSVARVQTYEDAQPKFLQDIKQTFSMLGGIISSIGLVVAAITIFIVIFINAITRRKYIGIMKAIGIDRWAIELSYVFQSLFFALVGSAIGLVLVYIVLVPYIAANPINFPFADGILVAPALETFLRLLLLVATTVIAGYIPARIIVSKNTLDSVLGRT